MAISNSKTISLTASHSPSTTRYDLTALFEETNSSITSNTSTLTVTATLYAYYGAFSDGGGTLEVYWFDDYNTTSGSLIASQKFTSLNNHATASISGNITVSHKTDGSLNGYAKAVWTRGTNTFAPSTGNVSTDNTALTTIPRYATITSFTVSKRDETSVLYNFSTDVSCDYAWYSADNGTNWYDLPNSGIVSGLSANTTYNFKLRVRRTDSQLTTDSGAYTQSTYSYPSITSISSFVIGDNITVTVNNPLGRTYSLSLTGNDGTVIGSYSGITNGNIIGFNDGTSQTNQYASLGTTGTSGYYTATLTYGSITSTKSSSYSINTNTCKPIINTGESYVVDVNSTTVNLTNDNTKLVSGISIARVRARVTRWSAQYDTTATISKYIYVKTGESFTNYVDISNATDTTYTIYAINSRGIASDTYNETIALHPYKAPIISNFKVARPTQVGNEMKISGNGTFYYGYFDTTNNKNWNSMTALWQVRTSLDNDWTDGGYIQDTLITWSTDGTWTLSSAKITNPLSTDGTWDYLTPYYFRLVITDTLKNAIATTYVSIGEAYYDWYRYNNANYFEVNGNEVVSGDITGNNIYANGQFKKDGGGSWISGRDNATVRNNSYGQSSGNSFNTVLCQKTTNGSWCVGNLSGDNKLYFSYTTDTNYNSKTNASENCYVENGTTGKLATIDIIYPIGSIYMSVNSTNPSSLFGGTWEQLQNRFLLGAGTSYSNGATGGSSTVTLTEAQMPTHSHTFSGTTSEDGSHTHTGHTKEQKVGTSSASSDFARNISSTYDYANVTITDSAGSHTHTYSGTTSTTGSSQAHDNMPPYLVVYMWKRTA